MTKSCQNSDEKKSDHALKGKLPVCNLMNFEEQRLVHAIKKEEKRCKLTKVNKKKTQEILIASPLTRAFEHLATKPYGGIGFYAMGLVTSFFQPSVRIRFQLLSRQFYQRFGEIIGEVRFDEPKRVTDCESSIVQSILVRHSTPVDIRVNLNMERCKTMKFKELSKIRIKQLFFRPSRTGGLMELQHGGALDHYARSRYAADPPVDLSRPLSRITTRITKNQT